MNKLTKTLILPAAAFAALLLAPASEARDVERGRGHESRGYDRPGRDRGYDRRGPERRKHAYHWAPRYTPAHRAYRYAAPYRVISGYRFYSSCPGPGWVYVAGGGWVLPPFFGAVWVPPHHDIGGFRVEGFWR